MLEVEKMKADNHAKEERRRQRIANAHRGEADRRKKLMDRLRKHSDHLRMADAKRGEEQAMRQTREHLRKQDKVDNINRMRRIDEFIRLQTLAKIQNDDERTRSLKEQKMHLLRERKQAAMEARRRRDRLASAMERARNNQGWNEVRAILTDDGDAAGKKKKKRGRKRRGLRGAKSMSDLGAP